MGVGINQLVLRRPIGRVILSPTAGREYDTKDLRAVGRYG